ncbi:MAG: RNA polymerase sigma factor [Candidatus Magasanikbacteria bacterium GW2011_GWA2_40_10]|uniref:RNA polymerase sigma factor n=1 Tax=Candidatus Magasanikbacteria bacterium GW2011_GWA2_40_10 TaxID=1619037 RepID=A0A0G0SIN3_9BACT|nr:MAG: RNA polymerase sigma factor [Candidatus Magasanikbacteria bacterium GW2011_GWA2_40_10]
MERNNSEKKIILDCLKGDNESLESLISLYLKPVYNFIYRYIGNAQDADDITQEVFIKMWRSLKKFDQNKNFKTWIFHIAKNTAIDFLKKKKDVSFSAFESEEGKNILTEMLADTALSAKDASEKEETAQALNSAVGKIPQKYGKVLSLYYYDQFNFREIAERLNESINTIKSRHRRALLILRKILGRNSLHQN